MKKYVYAVATVAVMMGTVAAFAQVSDNMGRKYFRTEDGRQKEEEMILRHRKEEMLLRIENRMAELQKQKTCLMAATEKKAIMKCMGEEPLQGVRPEGPTPYHPYGEDGLDAPVTNMIGEGVDGVTTGVPRGAPSEAPMPGVSEGSPGSN